VSIAAMRILRDVSLEVPSGSMIASSAATAPARPR